MKQKIIICSPQLGMATQSQLGGEVHDANMIKSLCDLGVQVKVILPRNKTLKPHKNLKVYYLPLAHIWPPFLFNLLILPQLFYIYQKQKFNILRVHSPYFVGLGAWFFKLCYPCVKLVATYHHLENKPIFNLINKHLIKKWDMVITVSHFTQKQIAKKYKIPLSKIKVHYSGINIKLSPKNKDKKLLKKHKIKKEKILLYLGGIKKRKNLDFLIRLFSQLKNKEVKLFLIGSGPTSASLKKLVYQLQLEKKVYFSNMGVFGKLKEKYLNLADIFVFPSNLEGFGLSPCEAALCAKPVIISSQGASSEILKGNRGVVLAKANNFKDWQEKIEFLLNNDKKNKKMGQWARLDLLRQIKKKYNWQHAARINLKIYQKLLSLK